MNKICNKIFKKKSQASIRNSIVEANFKIINYEELDTTHTIYTRNNMGQKCEGNCGLWVLNEILKETYPENLKKIVGAVWELPAK